MNGINRKDMTFIHCCFFIIQIKMAAINNRNEIIDYLSLWTRMTESTISTMIAVSIYSTDLIAIKRKKNHLF